MVLEGSLKGKYPKGYQNRKGRCFIGVTERKKYSDYVLMVTPYPLVIHGMHRGIIVYGRCTENDGCPLRIRHCSDETSRASISLSKITVAHSSPWEMYLNKLLVLDMRPLEL